jgi:hypothetical protein
MNDDRTAPPTQETANQAEGPTTAGEMKLTLYDLKKQTMALAAARHTLGWTHDGMASTLNFQPWIHPADRAG